MSGYGQYAEHYLAAGWHPLPLPHARKKSPPDGWTGYGNPLPTYADITSWLESGTTGEKISMTAQQVREGNVALRLRPDVVGIDVDAYKADAVMTMIELTQGLGDLPATWRSSSKDDGMSGIYFFRVPEGLRFGDVGPGVETIRHEHRYAIVAPSIHPGDPEHGIPAGKVYRWFAPDGSAKAPRVDQLPALPDAWINFLVERGRPRKEHVETTSVAYDALPDDEKQRIDGYVKTTLGGIKADLEESKTWGDGERDPRGRGWEKLQADKAIRLAALAMGDWNRYTIEQAEDDFIAWCPTGGGWTSRDVQAKWSSQCRRATPQPMPLAQPKVDIFANAQQPASSTPVVADDGFSVTQAATGTTVAFGDQELDAGNPAKAFDWLQANLGTGRLSGIFARGADIVFTPRLGEEGYVAPKHGEPIGTASISILDAPGLAARVQGRYKVVKVSAKDNDDGTRTFSKSPCLFPQQAALYVTRAPDDCPGLRPLLGVVHTPTFRADGTLIGVPGYDLETGLLFLPTGGQPAQPVPETPSQSDVELAKKWLSYMLQDFNFVGADDLANYLGLALTPLLRNIVPAPYKLGVIEAHQPGSGKTYLARALLTIHSGIMHSEMPGEEPELVKTITSMLDTSTGSIVCFDNVTGVVRSSALAGLLTSPTFQGRRLGTGKLVDVPNDRMWLITANNAALGGDLARRSVRVKIDPGVPNPERRTQFVIPDFEAWVSAHRGELLWSLLTLVRNWVAKGSPVPNEQRADSYGRWDAVIGSILACAGIGGTFDDPRAATTNDSDAEEWEAFFDQIYELHGEVAWTTKSLMGEVAPLGLQTLPGVTAPIAYDLLPSSLVTGRQAPAPASLARPLGIFLSNREGRWFGQYTIRKGGTSKRYQLWYIQKHG